MSTMHHPSPEPAPASGARLVSPDGRALPFVGASLKATASAGLAQVVLRQTFRNPHDEPLRVTYTVPLPADAAIGGFAFEFNTTRVSGEVERTQVARERYEDALMEGRTAALLEQDRSALFTQEVGNIPPHTQVVCELTLDQPLAWVDGQWEWRFPTVVAPRFLGKAGRVPDAKKQVIDVADAPLPARVHLDLHIAEPCTGAVRSPSHPLALIEGPDTRVGLAATDGAALDRDLVVRWPVAKSAPGLALAVSRYPSDHPLADRAFGLLTVVPPTKAPPSVPRDLIVLLDTSGSMHGAPLEQAKAIVTGLIASLQPTDRLELIEFSTRPSRWKSAPELATSGARAQAQAWVSGLRAGGATDMREGILAALASLRDEAQRQVVLVTDGLIGFEAEVLRAIQKQLPPGSRVHTVGVGHAPNRTLTAGAARCGRGIEVLVAPDESPVSATERLLARTVAPLVVGLQLSGSALHEAAASQLPDLYAGAPARLPLELNPNGGELVLTGRMATGTWQQALQLAPIEAGHGSVALGRGVARERVADLEHAHAIGSDGALDAIEALGLEFQIATRQTSWVAISKTTTVDPQHPTRTERIPHALPSGMSAEGLGLRAAGLGLRAAGSFRSGLRFAGAPMLADGMIGAPQATMALDSMGSHAPTLFRHSGTLRKLSRRDLALVEFAIADAGQWSCPGHVLLTLIDGSTVIATVDRARSTRDGPMAAGATLRLALLHNPHDEPLAMLEWKDGSDDWEVTL